MSPRVLQLDGSGSVSVPRWYAVYTAPRHEKKVAEHLAVREVEHFVPLYTQVRRWKDGTRATVREPLFPNYVFVHIPVRQRVKVLAAPGVLWIVGAKEPEPLPDEDIEILRTALPGRKCEPHPFLTVGNRVRVCRGPLCGAAGVVARIKSELRLVITMDLLMRSVAVEVDAGDLEAGAFEVEARRKDPAPASLPGPTRISSGSWAEARS